MHISPLHKARQESISGLTNGGSTIFVTTNTAPLALDPSTPAGADTTQAPALVSGSSIVVTSPTPTPTPSPSPSSSSAADASSASSSSSNIPIGTVIGICVGTFVGLAIIICIVVAWYKRSSDKMSAAARRNAEGHSEQRRARVKSFSKLGDTEKPHSPGNLGVNPSAGAVAGGALSPPSPATREQQELDEKNFSMFKKSPSVRTAYTHKTGEDEAYDLPQLEFSKYHPTLAEELALDTPEKPFAVASAARENSGVSWDGETLGDDSFLSMHSVRVESGTMSPTMVMAKMTPPATASVLHKWESAEVLNMEEAPSTVSRNPFSEMAEEQRSLWSNPFFNAQDMNRTSRIMRSRSNSRTSRTSRAQSLVRPNSSATQYTVMPSRNPFLNLQETLPDSATETLSSTSDGLSKPLQASVPSGASLDAFGNERAMASLIAALDLTKEEVQARLRVVSMQGSTFSAYSNEDSDIATMREFPLPPGTVLPHSP